MSAVRSFCEKYNIAKDQEHGLLWDVPVNHPHYDEYKAAMRHDLKNNAAGETPDPAQRKRGNPYRCMHCNKMCSLVTFHQQAQDNSVRCKHCPEATQEVEQSEEIEHTAVVPVNSNDPDPATGMREHYENQFEQVQEMHEQELNAVKGCYESKKVEAAQLRVQVEKLHTDQFETEHYFQEHCRQQDDALKEAADKAREQDEAIDMASKEINRQVAESIKAAETIEQKDKEIANLLKQIQEQSSPANSLNSVLSYKNALLSKPSPKSSPSKSKRQNSPDRFMMATPAAKLSSTSASKNLWGASASKGKKSPKMVTISSNAGQRGAATSPLTSKELFPAPSLSTVPAVTQATNTTTTAPAPSSISAPALKNTSTTKVPALAIAAAPNPSDPDQSDSDSSSDDGNNNGNKNNGTGKSGQPPKKPPSTNTKNEAPKDTSDDESSAGEACDDDEGKENKKYKNVKIKGADFKQEKLKFGTNDTVVDKLQTWYQWTDGLKGSCISAYPNQDIGEAYGNQVVAKGFEMHKEYCSLTAAKKGAFKPGTTAFKNDKLRELNSVMSGTLKNRVTDSVREYCTVKKQNDPAQVIFEVFREIFTGHKDQKREITDALITPKVDPGGKIESGLIKHMALVVTADACNISLPDYDVMRSALETLVAPCMAIKLFDHQFLNTQSTMEECTTAEDFQNYCTDLICMVRAHAPNMSHPTPKKHSANAATAYADSKDCFYFVKDNGCKFGAECTYAHKKKDAKHCSNCGSIHHDVSKCDRPKPDKAKTKYANKADKAKAKRTRQKARKAAATPIDTHSANKVEDSRTNNETGGVTMAAVESMMDKKILAHSANLSQNISKDIISALKSSPAQHRAESVKVTIIGEKANSAKQPQWEFDSCATTVTRTPEAHDRFCETHDAELTVASGDTINCSVIQGECVGKHFAQLIPMGKVVNSLGQSVLWTPNGGIYVSKLDIKMQKRTEAMFQGLPHTIKIEQNEQSVPILSNAQADTMRRKLRNNDKGQTPHHIDEPSPKSRPTSDTAASAWDMLQQMA